MLCANLYVHRGIFLKVPIPERVAITPAERRRRHDAVTVTQIQRCRGTWFSGSAALRRNQRRRKELRVADATLGHAYVLWRRLPPCQSSSSPTGSVSTPKVA